MNRYLFLLLILLAPLAGTAADGLTQTSFVVDAPFAEVTRKFDSEQSLRRVLGSQGIELLTYKLTNRKLNLLTQTVNAEVQIKGRAARISPTPGDIRQTIQLGLKNATMEFLLLKPVGQLAEQRYTVGFSAIDQKTRISIEIYTRVYVPQRRLRGIQRLINRVARRIVADELCRNLLALQQEMTAIIAENRPADAKSILVP